MTCKNQDFTFIVAGNNDSILKTNFLNSPLFRRKSRHQIIIQRGFQNAGNAYNDGIRQSENDIMVFSHQDLFLPERWDEKLMNNIKAIERENKEWGVLGCFGITAPGGQKGHLWCNANQKNMGAGSKPTVVRSLDEVLLVLSKKRNILFSRDMEGFHLYGTDICLESEKRGLKNYAIDAWCFHNSESTLYLPREYFKSVRYIRKKWKDSLPIHTPCLHIRYNSALNNMIEQVRFNLKRLRRDLFRRGRQSKISRVPDPESKIREIRK